MLHVFAFPFCMDNGQLGYFRPKNDKIYKEIAAFRVERADIWNRELGKSGTIRGWSD